MGACRQCGCMPMMVTDTRCPMCGCEDAWTNNGSIADADKTIGDYLKEIYTNPVERVRWWDAPQSLFKGETPRNMVASGRKAEVINALRQILDGVYI